MCLAIPLIAVPIECKESEQCFNSAQFALSAALFFVIFYNAAFFEHVIALVDQSSVRGIIFIANVSLVLWLLTSIVVALVTLPYVVKPILSLLFVGGASVAYFMDAYGVVIHRLMIQSTLETDYSETRDLINMSLVLYLVALGFLPLLLLRKVNLRFGSFKVECWRKAKLIVGAFIGCLALILSMSMDYASFFATIKKSVKWRIRSTLFTRAFPTLRRVTGLSKSNRLKTMQQLALSEKHKQNQHCLF